MRAWLTAVAVACAVLPAGNSIAAGAASRHRSTSPPVETVSREVHRILGAIKHTKYTHPTRVDEAAGGYELDCSGLACYVLKRVLPDHYRNVTIPKGQSRATAMNFHDYFAKAPTTVRGRDGWRRIERIADARPGDILAWRAAVPKPGSTGHVVIIDGRPTLTRDGQVCVPVVDSTSTGHGNDTRAKGQTGIGRGLMWFAVDAQGRPTGYRWSHAGGKLQSRSIAIGRPVPIR